MDNFLRALPALLSTIDSPEVIEAAVIACWNHTVGEGLRDHTLPLRVESRVLFVAVADQIWKQQLSKMCGQLVYRLNDLLGRSLVDRIELVIEPTKIKHRSIDNRDSFTFDEREVPVELLAAASAIADKELRRTFLQTATIATKRRESETAR